MTPEARARLERRLVSHNSSHDAIDPDLREALATIDAQAALLDRAREVLGPFEKINWPSLTDAEGEEGDLPDSAIVEVEATDYCVSASDWFDDPDFILTVGDFRAAAALHAELSE